MARRLVIEIGDDGRLNVNGPIDDKILAYGMLDVARDAIHEHHLKKAESKIVPASILPAGLMPGGSDS